MAGYIPLVNNHLYRAVLFGIFNNEVQTRNVFHYTFQSEGSTTPSATLTDAAYTIFNMIKNSVLPETSHLMGYYQVAFADIDPATFTAVNEELYTEPTGTQVGTVTGDALPPQDAWTFKYVRGSSGFRHGYKRFCGVPESQQSIGYPEGGGVATALANIAATLANNQWVIRPGEPDPILPHQVLSPVIIRAERGGLPVRPVLWQSPQTVVFERVGTQNSRKYNRGI